MTLLIVFLLFFVAVEQGFILWLLLDDPKRKKKVQSEIRVSGLNEASSPWEKLSEQERRLQTLRPPKTRLLFF